METKTKTTVILLIRCENFFRCNSFQQKNLLLSIFLWARSWPQMNKNYLYYTTTNTNDDYDDDDEHHGIIIIVCLFVCLSDLNWMMIMMMIRFFLFVFEEKKSGNEKINNKTFEWITRTNEWWWLFWLIESSRSK